MRWAVGASGVALSLLPWAFSGGPVAVGLVALGILATAVGVVRGSAGAPTIVSAAAIGQVADAGHAIPPLGVVAVGALLAVFLAVAEVSETHGGRAALGVHAAPALFGVVAVAVLVAVGALPTPAGGPATGFALAGIVAAGLVVHLAASMARQARGNA